MKKLLFFIGSLKGGGAERVVTILANYFIEDGYDVGIVTLDVVNGDYGLNKGIKLYPYLGNDRNRVLRILGRVPFIHKVVKEVNPDLCISFLAEVNVHVILGMLGLKNKLIVSERNDPSKDPKEKWQRSLRDKTYKYASGIVFQTVDAEKYFDNLITKKVKTKVIANPIKDNLPINNNDSNNQEFITACRLSPQKNLKMMIDGFANVLNKGYNCNLKIYGEGSSKKDIQNYINDKQMNEYIELCGFVNDINDKMAKASGFLITSDYEGMSNSMLEALAIGTPVVATDCPVGAARMFIRNNETGYLIDCNDVNALTNSIIDILDNREKATRMAKQAMKLRETLSTSNIVDEWKKFMLEVFND